MHWLLLKTVLWDEADNRSVGESLHKEALSSLPTPMELGNTPHHHLYALPDSAAATGER